MSVSGGQSASVYNVHQKSSSAFVMSTPRPGSRLRFGVILTLTQHVVLPLEILWCVLRDRCSPFELTVRLCRIAGVRLHVSSTSAASLSKSPKTIFLCNHRGWGDFVIDSALTSGATYLAKHIVGMILPYSALYSQLTGNVLFFGAQPKTDRAQLAQWLDAHWGTRPNSALLVYPEGTRNQRAS